MEFNMVVQGINKETGEVGKVTLNLPVKASDVLELTGINAEADELVVLDHGFGFDIGESVWLHEINRLAIKCQELENDPRIKGLKVIADEWYGGNVSTALAHIDEVRYLKGIEDYKQLADKFITRFKTGTYIAPFMRQFFDVGAYASYLSSQGGYVFSGGAVFYQKQKTQEIEA